MSDNILSVGVDTFSSPNAGLKPVPLTAVNLTDSFWAPRLHTNRDATLTEVSMLEEPKERRLSGSPSGVFIRCAATRAVKTGDSSECSSAQF